MLFTVTEHFTKTAQHGSFYLASGPEAGPLIIFIHGWPELSHSWRHQLRCFGALGFHCVAPDMRGYGRSSIYSTHADYALEYSVRDMLDLLAHLGRDRAIWVGHDWAARSSGASPAITPSIAVPPPISAFPTSPTASPLPT
jgi:pimeloyl-ACP methyl ester carboxylesterase